MKKRMPLIFALAGVMSLFTWGAQATDKPPVQDKTQVQGQEQVYGSQLMTEQERVEYQAKMRAAQTPEDREQIRNQHHQAMQERAKTQGLTLPDEPPMRGGGMGPGPGPGRGMGPGGGGYGR